MKKVLCATLDNLDAVTVEVEVNFIRGLPKFQIVGLPSGTIQESKERVKSALISNSFRFPPLNITINLSPSDIKKNGSHFDLSIALIIALFNHDLDAEIEMQNIFVFGELGLDGTIKDTNLIFPLVLSLKEQKLITENNLLVVPKNSLEKLSKIPNIKLLGVSNLFETIEYFNDPNSSHLEVLKTEDNFDLDLDFIEINNTKYFYNSTFELDMNEVYGQIIAKRAGLISVAGMHNLILTGSPGSGKSMIAKRLGELLPPLSAEEMLEVAKIESLGGQEPNFNGKRPFRSPHHTASKGSIFGGGTKSPKIGEISMANLGVLFFDELPHFSKQTLEALREPLQDLSILISRVENKVKYPANFLFIGAMNPCKCGFLLSETHTCRCTPVEVTRYKNKLSEPFWDRIDLTVAMQEVSSNDQPTVSSKNIYEQVLTAFKMQKSRGQKNLNGRLNDKEINEFINLNSDENKNILETATQRFGLSLRAINKIKKVARTIADLDNSEDISKNHLMEALTYRRRD
jgi:magnesium chelatase family protein